MLNEYRFQETGIEEQTEVLKYINSCGFMFFPLMHTFSKYYSQCAEKRIFGSKQTNIFISSLKEEPC